ncbi:hypothetical protein EJB05_31903, partial [Eragrostis curvula]
MQKEDEELGELPEKADVYSFGVVVMEIISGRKNLDTSRSEESIHLITLLEEKVKSNKLADLIDKNSSDMQAHKQEIRDKAEKQTGGRKLGFEDPNFQKQNEVYSYLDSPMVFLR